jgi:hypothetical protein
VREAQVRERLRGEVLATAPKPSEAVYEFWVPTTNTRADVAVIGTAIAAFEIKTERDTLKRLARQVAAYGRLFDQCTAVLAERHLDAAVEIVPDWWGLLVIPAEPDAVFRTVRPPQPNHHVDAEIVVRLLWREEVHALLAELGAEPHRGAGRSTMWAQLLKLVDLESLKLSVCQTLLRRDPASARFPARRFCVAEVAT